MKPLQLTMSAYGPFADTQTVDFRPLAEHQVFLIWGPTGSGKTSMFDAMAYALYGKLPGNRSAVTEIRSDHAAVATATVVTFEFECTAGQFRVTRKPKQLRQASRGSGFTEDGTKAVLERFNGTAYEPISDRPTDVTAKCEELVGLNSHQFQRVVLLPQGQFQRVLLADTLERKELLRTLFDTTIYQGLEDHLKDQAAKVGERVRADHALRERLESQLVAEHQRLHDTARQATGRGEESFAIDVAVAELRALEVAAVEAERAARAEYVRAQTTADDVAALIERRRLMIVFKAESVAQAAERLVLERAASAVGVTPLLHDFDQLEAELIELDYSASQLINQLDSVGEASPGINLVTGSEALAVIAKVDRDIATTRDRIVRLNRLLEIKHTLLEITSRHAEIQSRLDELDVASSATNARLVATRAAQTATKVELDEASLESGTLMLAQQRVDDFVAIVDAHRSRAALTIRAQQLLDLYHAHEGVASDLEAQHQHLATMIGSAVEVIQQRQSITERLAATARLGALRDRHESLTADLGRRTIELDATHERAKSLLTAYIAASAPRLAAELIDGQPCAVCGSLHHPRPAVDRSERVVDLSEVEAANTALSFAHEQVTSCVTSLHELRAQHANIERVDAAQIALRLAEETTILSQIDAAEKTATEHQAQLDAVLISLHENKNARDALTAERGLVSDDIIRQTTILGLWHNATATEIVEHNAGLMAENQRRVAVENSRASRTLLLAGIDAEITQLTLLANDESLQRGNLTAQFNAASQHVAELTLSLGIDEVSTDFAPRLVAVDNTLILLESLRDNRFTALERGKQRSEAAAKLQVWLSSSPFASLDECVSSTLDSTELGVRQAAALKWQHAREKCAIELAALKAKSLPDQLPDLVVLAQAVDRAAQQVTVAARNAGAVNSVLESVGIATRSRDAHEQLSAAAQESDRRVMAVAEICTGQNSAKASIESWVLSAYLTDVVVHANHHLSTMSNGRYQLVLTSAVLDRRRQSGLDLVVLDEHTGVQRAVNTLSGGETFQASLALALGLADIVAGAGGARIDAVFIDEGFGSLDADSLQQTIDVLTHLGSHGAMVGVITHVPAMRDQIAVGIEVRPESRRRGSRIVQFL